MGKQNQIDKRVGESRYGRGSGCWLIRLGMVGLALLVGLAPFPLRAQTNSVQPKGNRYLFIVDTSRSMQRRSEAMLQVVRGLILSGFNGQIRRGDTLGLWTFNQGLYAGRLPLQVWSHEGREEIAARTIAFLETQQYAGRANFDSVQPALDRVIGNSDQITIMLISSGDEKVQGTPFDPQIADYYRRGRNQQKKAQMPFVTILRAQLGQLIHCSLNMAPQALQFPPLPEAPPEVVAGKPSDPKRPAEAKSSASSDQPKKQPRPEEAPVAKPAPVPVKAEAPVPSAMSTNDAKATAIKSSAISAIPAKVEQAKAAPAEAKTPAPVLLLPKAEPPAPIIKPKIAPELVEPKVGASSPVASSAPKSEADAPPKPVPAPESKPTPPPPPLVRESAGTSSLATATNIPFSSSPSVPAIVSSPAGAVSVVQTAAVAAATPSASRKNLWLAALALALITGGIVALHYLQRSRSAPQGSLITHSIERRKKP
ncbi:MAG TPA: hypothetical protein PLL56_10040 [Verrucomicrobiota bacterium]|nr:hypothetical protein [Verrucomicrobiota bacterium]